MALRLEDKKQLVKEVNAVADDSVTAVAAEYRGLSVAEMTELRKEARNAGVYMRVVKNTLARRAVRRLWRMQGADRDQRLGRGHRLPLLDGRR